MGQNLLLQDLAVIFGISLPIIFIFNKLKLPALIGYLICGSIIGPNGIGFISSGEHLDFISNLGVIFLLFFIGIELSIDDFFKFGKKLVFMGFFQFIITTLIFALVFNLFHLSVKTSFFLGILGTISGTAVFLKLLKDRNELNSPQGRIGLSINLFQDISSLAVILLMPLLSEKIEPTIEKIALKLLLALSLLFLIIWGAKFIFPKFIFQLAKLKNREAFTIGIILLIFVSAYSTSLIGLSLALGAFIAGLVLSESDYSYQIVADILPLKDAFISVFFVSLGSMFDFNLFANFWQTIVLLALLTIILKTSIISIIVKLFNFPARVGIVTGLYLANIGEFSFVLALEGLKLKIINNEVYSIFLSVSIITIVLSPFLFFLVPYFSKSFAKLDQLIKDEKANCSLSSHIVIVGFGVVGRNLAKVLKETGLPYAVIELNPDIYRYYKTSENMIFGDAARYEILQKACLPQAKVLAITSGENFSIQLICKLAKNLNPNLTIIARARYVSEINSLIASGCDEVIPDEFEASIQMFSRALAHYHIPYNAVARIANLIRKESYLILREDEAAALSRIDKFLAEGLIENYFVDYDNPHAGKAIGEINLRARSGATILAIVREGKMQINPSANDIIYSRDVLVLYGNHDAIEKAIKILDGNEFDL